MREKASLEELLQQHNQLQLTFQVVESVENWCEYAKRFRSWTKPLCEQAIGSGDLMQINQSKVRLLDRFFEWRVVIPKAHRNRVGEQGHICVFQVFEQAYQSLKIAELSSSGGPLLFIPTAPPAKVVKVYKFDSFPIGEVEDDEDEE